jgi:hypothetical protein
MEVSLHRFLISSGIDGSGLRIKTPVIVCARNADTALTLAKTFSREMADFKGLFCITQLGYGAPETYNVRPYSICTFFLNGQVQGYSIVDSTYNVICYRSNYEKALQEYRRQNKHVFFGDDLVIPPPMRVSFEVDLGRHTLAVCDRTRDARKTIQLQDAPCVKPKDFVFKAFTDKTKTTEQEEQPLIEQIEDAAEELRRSMLIPDGIGRKEAYAYMFLAV